jgi:hypothetical protein
MIRKLPTCSICLEKIKSSEKISLDCCKNDFHLKCIYKWQCIKDNCPLCRHTDKNKYKPINDIFLGIKLMLLLR